MMMRLNGVGLWLLGVSPAHADGTRFATQWFTFFFLPIFPLYRVKVRTVQRRPFRFLVLEKSKLNWREVGKTYLYAWILFPLFIFPPFFLAVLFPPLLFLDLILLIVVLWKIKDWEEGQWFK